MGAVGGEVGEGGGNGTGGGVKGRFRFRFWLGSGSEAPRFGDAASVFEVPRFQGSGLEGKGGRLGFRFGLGGFKIWRCGFDLFHSGDEGGGFRGSGLEGKRGRFGLRFEGLEMPFQFFDSLSGGSEVLRF